MRWRKPPARAGRPSRSASPTTDRPRTAWPTRLAIASSPRNGSRSRRGEEGPGGAPAPRSGAQVVEGADQRGSAPALALDFRSMKRILIPVALLCATAARAEIKERIAAIVNGQPITLSEVEERVGPELARVQQISDETARARDKSSLLHQGLEQLIDEKLIESEAHTIGADVSEDEVQRGLEQLARQSSMEVPEFKEALEQQGISWETARETVRRQQLMGQVLRFKVKPRKITDEEVQTAYAAVAKAAEYEV